MSWSNSIFLSPSCIWCSWVVEVSGRSQQDFVTISTNYSHVILEQQRYYLKAIVTNYSLCQCWQPLSNVLSNCLKKHFCFLYSVKHFPWWEFSFCWKCKQKYVFYGCVCWIMLVCVAANYVGNFLTVLLLPVFKKSFLSSVSSSWLTKVRYTKNKLPICTLRLCLTWTWVTGIKQNTNWNRLCSPWLLRLLL